MSKKNDWTEFEFTDERFVILHTTQTYERTATGKCWAAKPAKETFTVESPEFYQNFIRSIPWFNNYPGEGCSCTATCGYTAAGNLPYRVNTVGPGKTTKLVDEFEFVYKRELLKDAGFREEDVVENATWFRIECGWEYKVLTLMYEDTDHELRTAKFDLNRKRWVG